MNSCGIYKIENLITHKVYIGQSIHIFQRWKEHFHHESMPWLHSLLYDDFAAYGIENFSFQILELCDEEQLDEKEIYYIEKYNAYEDGLNSNMGNQPIYDDEAKKIKKKMYDQKYRKRTQEKNERAILDFDWSPYLDKCLFSEDKKDICNMLNLKRDNGKKMGFVAISRILDDNGYTILHRERKKNKSDVRRRKCIIISKD